MFKLNPVAWLICIAMLPLSGCDQKTVANTMGGTAPAVATPAAASTYTPLSADQLYQLVSPVALFPDKLLAQVRVIPIKSARRIAGWRKTGGCNRPRLPQPLVLNPGTPAYAVWYNFLTCWIRWLKIFPGPPRWAALISTTLPT